MSNVSPAHIQDLLEDARVPPMVVQNRCYAVRGWDKAARGLCAQAGIVYQGFSLLTANPQVVGSKVGGDRAAAILPLTGTTDAAGLTPEEGAVAG